VAGQFKLKRLYGARASVVKLKAPLKLCDAGEVAQVGNCAGFLGKFPRFWATRLSGWSQHHLRQQMDQAGDLDIT
jgi:hypothetical protein